jgi:DNA-directed RNA polymerase specialized sigma24 family protein
MRGDVDQLIERLSLESEIGRNQEPRWTDSETCALVERYIASLDPDLARVHEALYVKGLSQREAASAFGLGRQAIRTLEAKLRAGLRHELEQRGRLDVADAGSEPVRRRSANRTDKA